MSVKDVQRALKKHKEGTLDKKYYAPDGHLYAKTISRGMDPKKAQKRVEERERAQEKKLVEKMKNRPKRKERTVKKLTEEDIEKFREEGRKKRQR